jgi:hypothetical protein
VACRESLRLLPADFVRSPDPLEVEGVDAVRRFIGLT